MAGTFNIRQNITLDAVTKSISDNLPAGVTMSNLVRLVLRLTKVRDESTLMKAFKEDPSLIAAMAYLWPHVEKTYESDPNFQKFIEQVIKK